jgi:hypothetical protein
MLIRDRIFARRDLDGLREARDLDGLAAALNAAPEMTVQPRFVTARAVMAGCPDGVAILDALDAAAPHNSAVRRAVAFLQQEAGLDVGDPYTQRMIGELADAHVLTESQAAQLKALALKPVYVDRLEIEAALYNRDTTEK